MLYVLLNFMFNALQINDICIILRNLCMGDGLSNNTRVKIVRILHNCVVVQLVEFPFTVLSIPRVRFQYRLPYSESFEIMRSQYPLRRAFALTYNKSQGQTLERVLLDVRLKLFNHGYLYVGMSRVQLYSNAALYLNNERIFKDKKHRYHMAPMVTNIVYLEALTY